MKNVKIIVVEGNNLEQLKSKHLLYVLTSYKTNEVFF
jgi:hypothetical protein